MLWQRKPKVEYTAPRTWTAKKDNSYLIANIKHVLASSAALQLRFRLGDVHFDGAFFVQVVRAIDHRAAGGGKGIHVDSGRGLGLSYRKEENRLMFPSSRFGNDRLERAKIVHEAIHAALDEHHRGVKERETEESVAYVGMMLFYIYDNAWNGREPPDFPAEWVGNQEEHYKYAYLQVAYDIAKEIATRRGGPRTPEVTWRGAKDLREALRQNPDYDKDFETSPGVRNDGVW